MATVVSVMDRPGWFARTDNIVVVDPDARSLLWVPRDLWCDGLGDRINVAYRRGAHQALIDALAEHGITVAHSLCLARAAVGQMLDGVVVTVPVDEDRAYWYPLEPERPIEDGRKLVEFRVPEEALEGERLHQWIGARIGVDRPSDDFDRIERQQTLVRRLLTDGSDVRWALDDRELVSVSSPEAYAEIGAARATWRFATFDDVLRRTIAGKAVLVDRQLVSMPRRSWWRLSAWLAGWFAAARRRLRAARRASS